MEKILFFILLITSAHFLSAQDSLSLKQKKIQGFSISYFGQGYTHYGAKIGTEYPLWSKEKIKTKKDTKQIHKNKLIFATANVGFYVHRRNHIGLFANSEVGYRKTRGKGFRYEFLFGLGYLHTFLQGDTYEVKDDGSVERVFLAGRPSLMTSLCGGLGYDFDYHYHKQFSVFLKPGFFVQYPFNTAIVARPTIELGLFYTFKR